MSKHLILLHGALAQKHQFDELLPLLHCGEVLPLNFPGHGDLPLTNTTVFNLPALAEYVLSMMDKNGIQQADLMGYSMGGYVAMYLVNKHPDRFTGILTLATKYRWNPEIALQETARLNPEVLAEKAPAFVAQLQTLHPHTDWKLLLNQTAAFMSDLGQMDYLHPEKLSRQSVRSCIAVGDRDKMVTLDETLQVFKALPDSQLAVLPDTPHPFERMNMSKVAQLVNAFFG
jgi:pimeloyl-ACP methyl ester carboxylesterase